MIKTELKLAEPPAIQKARAIMNDQTKALDDAKERQKRKPSGNAKTALTIRLTPAAYIALMAAGGRQAAEELIERQYGSQRG